MPVEFPNGPLDEVLLRTGYVMARREILDDLFPDPSPPEDASLGVRETPLQVRDDSRVGGLLAQAVRVLDIQSRICAPYPIAMEVSSVLAGRAHMGIRWHRELTHYRRALPGAIDGLAVGELCGVSLSRRHVSRRGTGSRGSLARLYLSQAQA